MNINEIGIIIYRQKSQHNIIYNTLETKLLNYPSFLNLESKEKNDVIFLTGSDNNIKLLYQQDIHFKKLKIRHNLSIQ